MIFQKRKTFEGWYFKHQKEERTIAFIPGRAEGEAFVQMITEKNSRQFAIAELSVDCGIVRADHCLFSPFGCKIDLPEVTGRIFYDKISPLSSDIMGPFCFLPMQCRHGVISMAHRLQGSIVAEGEKIDFSGGRGYIEKDSGTSFPRSYQWLQCNDFSENCALMVSIAHIPFGFTSFTGCIASVLYENKEYRFATYLGVHIHGAQKDHICLSQGNRLLEIDIFAEDNGFLLRSPLKGTMSGRIREISNVGIRVKLWENQRQVFDLESNGAAYEYVPDEEEREKEYIF